MAYSIQFIKNFFQSWAVFEPHKTTIRRTPLREGRKADVEKPLSIPHMLEESISSQQKERITPSTLHPSRNKVGQDALKVEESKSSISQLKRVNNDKGLQAGCLYSPAKANSSSISSKLLLGQSSGKTTGGLISEKAVFRGSSGNDPHDIKLESPADTKDGKANMDAPFKTFMMPQSHLNETPKPTAQWNFTMPTKGAGNQSAHVFVAPEAPALGRKAPDFNEGSSRSQSGTEVISLPTSSSPPSQLSLFSSVSVSAAPTLFPISSVTKSSPLSDDSLNTKSDSVAGKLMFPVSTSFSSSTPFSEKLKLPEQPLNGASQSDRATEKQQQEKFPPLMATPSVSEPPTSNVFAPKPVDSLPQAEITKSSEKGKSQLNVGGESVPPTSNIFAPKPDNSLAQAAITNNSDKGKSQLNVGGESVPRTSGFSFNDPAVSEPKVKIQEEGKSSEKFSFGGIADDGMNSIQKSKLEQPLPATNGSAATEKTDSSLNTGYQEDEMEEEAPETSPVAELSLGSLGGFGLGSTPTQAAATPNRNPFGGSFINPSASPPSSPFTSSSAGGELFRPASFSFSPTQSTQTPQPATSSFGGFGSSTTPVGFGFAANQAPSGGGFGQPAQAGQGIQALGSVLGSFGQSRQIGIGQPINSFAPATGFGSGFTSTQSAGGFANAATKPSGFAALASNSGGFAALASNSGGFAAATSGGNTPGGFAGAASSTGGGGFGGFAGAAAPTGGSGFGGFAGAGGGGGFGQQGSSFSAFGSGTGAQPPPQLFTQMRK